MQRITAHWHRLNCFRSTDSDQEAISNTDVVQEAPRIVNLEFFKLKFHQRSARQASLLAQVPTRQASWDNLQFEDVAPQPAPDSCALIQEHVTQLDLPFHFDNLTSPLRTIFGLGDASIEDIHEESQQRKLFSWGEIAKVAIDSNTRELATQQGMSTIFQATQPDLNQISHAPQAMVVPLGFHSFNAARVGSLKEALEKLLDKFGQDGLKDTHIYFLGGRKLTDGEKRLPTTDQLAMGLGAYCSSDWKQLTDEQKQTYPEQFKSSVNARLGPDENFNLSDQAQTLYEKDSAQRIWCESEKLEQLRAIFSDRVHFIETSPAEYKKGQSNRDNTHGNAIQFLKHYSDQNENADGGEKSTWICSDPFFCPRASLIFKGYCGQVGMKVSSYSTPLTDDDQHWLPHLLAMPLRESVCMLNEVVQFAENGDKWFDPTALKSRY